MKNIVSSFDKNLFRIYEVETLELKLSISLNLVMKLRVWYQGLV